MTKQELYEIIKNNLDFLSQIGDLNSEMLVDGMYVGTGFIAKQWNSINEFLNEFK